MCWESGKLIGTKKLISVENLGSNKCCIKTPSGSRNPIGDPLPLPFLHVNKFQTNLTRVTKISYKFEEYWVDTVMMSSHYVPVDSHYIILQNIKINVRKHQFNFDLC